MKTTTSWGPWKAWDPTMAIGPPPECPPGTVVQADLIIRATKVGMPDRPAINNGYIFTVRNGESFALNPPWIHAKDITATHLVTRYRVQVEETLTEVTEEMEVPVS